MSLNHNNPKRIKLNKLEIETIFRQLVEFVEQSCLVFNGKSSIGDSSKIGQLIKLDELVNSYLIIEPLISLNCDIETFIWNFFSNYLVDNLDSTILSEIQWKCESIIDWCWQLINHGKWTEVSIELRKFYAYHHQLKAILLLLSLVVGDEEESTTTKDNSILQTLIDALQSIDQGLIMSPDLPGSILSKSASFLNQTIVHQLKHPSNNIVETDNKIFDQWNRLIKLFKTSVTNLLLPKPNNIFPACQQIPKIELLDFFQFQHQYFESKTPVIITGATEDWPCLGGSRQWTLQYLLEKAAFRRVPIEIGSKYTDDEWSQRVMSFIDFLEQFIVGTNQIGYLAQHNLFEQITDLADDFTIPDYCGAIESSTDDNCDEDSSSTTSVEINGWFGPAGTVSPLHTDSKHNLFVQIMGQKYIRLYSDQTPADQIYPHHDSILLGNTSRVDLESIEQRTTGLYPEFSNIDPKLIYECVLGEGELLFIPKLYWHFVKSLSTSFSISFWW